MRQTLRDYGYKLSKFPLLCDNESAIRMADNPVEHSRTVIPKFVKSIKTKVIPPICVAFTHWYM
jgi:hypothetical protein